MKIPYRLTRAAEPGSVSGLLLLSSREADLLALLAEVGEPLPTVFVLPDSFLLKLHRPESRWFAGVVRLRRLAVDLFVPFEAMLVPALFDDEAEGLTRTRGLVFLPGGDILAYDPRLALPLAALVSAPRRPARNWVPLPPRPSRPDRLLEVRLDLPGTLEEDLGVAGSDIGAEEVRPPQAGPMATAGGRAQAGLGQLLVWLGRLCSWRDLARRGADLVRGALERVPRITEDILGRQEAALRALLQRFQDGDVDEALRHALPLGSEGGRGGTPAADANLPTHQLRYSLGELLGEKQVRASVWLGGGNVQEQLGREYRKAAEAAAARGDYRRAAYIYYRLLKDFRSAAAILERGGLHRDAARIYLERLNEPLAAARAFAAAGDLDQALALYRRLGCHLDAADLLRQAGDLDGALEEYQIAANKLTQEGNHLAAGDVLRERAGRPDLAVERYRAGWETRPGGGAWPCLLRLLEGENQVPAFLALAEEGDTWFSRPEATEVEAGQFFNTLARLADRPAFATVRVDLRDRALLGLAGRLRGSARAKAAPGPVVSALLGQQGVWPVPVVHDGESAYRAAYTAPAPPPLIVKSGFDRVRLGVGLVTAACQATETGRVFVGFRDGALARFDPQTGSVIRQPGVGMAVAHIATDPLGGAVVAVLKGRTQGCGLVSFRIEDTFSDRRTLELPISSEQGFGLTPLHPDGNFGVWGGHGLAVYSSDLVRQSSWAILDSKGWEAEKMLAMVLLLEPSRSIGNLALFLTEDTLGFFSGAGLVHYSLGGRVRRATHLVSENTLRVRQHNASGHDGGNLNVEVVRCGSDGCIYWNRQIIPQNPAFKAPSDLSGSRAVSSPSDYLAATLLQPGHCAGVRVDGVDWLHATAGQLQVVGSRAYRLANTVACFASPLTRELLILSRDGHLSRIPQPR